MTCLDPHHQSAIGTANLASIRMRIVRALRPGRIEARSQQADPLVPVTTLQTVPLSAEDLQEQGRTGVLNVKRWLEATWRFDVPFNVYDRSFRTSLTLLDGSIKKYDLFAHHCLNDAAAQTPTGTGAPPRQWASLARTAVSTVLGSDRALASEALERRPVPAAFTTTGWPHGVRRARPGWPRRSGDRRTGTGETQDGPSRCGVIVSGCAGDSPRRVL